MIEIVEFEAKHCQDLLLQDAQSLAQPLLVEPDYVNALVDGGPHFSAMVNGMLVGCAGVWMIEPHRGIAWALIARDIGIDIVHMHKAVKRFLDESGVPRIETSVNYDFTQGHKWMGMLGFKAEGVMRKYYPDGSDAILYARVQ